MAAEMNRYYVCYPGFRKKAFTVSYDDGVVQDITLTGIFRKYGIKGTFNLNGASLSGEKLSFGGRTYLPAKDVQRVYDGFEIACHTYNHPCPSETPAGVFSYEILRDREYLEKLTGKIVRGLAYPQGSRWVHVENVEAARYCGIAYGRTTDSTNSFRIPEDWLRLNPTCRHKSPRLWELCESFLARKPEYGPEMFYLWGHAYEFDDDGNWELAESFAQKMSGQEDIWYASNIEICNYLRAAKGLVASADSSIVWNPSSETIWLDNRGTGVKVAPGSTVKLEN